MRIYWPELEHRQQVIGYGRGAGWFEIELSAGTVEPQISSAALRSVEKHFQEGASTQRSLRCATPDFLLSLVALANFMRLSLKKAAHVVMSSAAWQEIRVASVEMTKERATVP
jgi:hypothetical protein